MKYALAGIARILAVTEGYSYFLQEWGKHTWDVASQSPITARAVDIASREATAALDQNFFCVALIAWRPAKCAICAPWRSMIWSPGHGDTSFTASMFDAFMRRIMPGDDWCRV